VVETRLADPAGPSLERVESREQEVTARPRRVAAVGDPAFSLDPALTSGPAARRPDLGIEDRVDGRPLGGCRERPDDVQIQ
jgi:hypothetical protein